MVVYILSENEVIIVLEKLFHMYPDAKCELNYSTSFELLIATVLSAQTTDKKVNQVTEVLFKEYNKPKDFLRLTQEELENKIREIGLYKGKAKHILSLCNSLIQNFNGDVPKTMEELMSLDGVGRKTANVVLSNAFDIPAFAVDTHVFRVSNRIGICNGKDAKEVEFQLVRKIPKELWIVSHHTLIFHGRKICKSAKPICNRCDINDLCELYLMATPIDNDF